MAQQPRKWADLRRQPEAQPTHGALSPVVRAGLAQFGRTAPGQEFVDWLDDQLRRTCPPGIADGAWRDFEAERRVFARLAFWLTSEDTDGVAPKARR